MSEDDDLKRLQEAMREATPPPRPEVKAAHLRLAKENFAALQGSREGMRHTPERPKGRARLKEGVFAMFHSLTTRGALAATTSIMAVGLGFFVLWPGMGDLRAPDPAGPRASVPVKAEGTPEIAADDGLRKPEGRIANAGAEAAGATAMPPQAQADAMMAKPPATEEFSADIQAAPPAAIAPAPAMRKRGESMLIAPFDPPVIAPPEANTEAFANAEANPVKITADEPVSTFSIDVDTASWAIVRSSLMRGQLPPPEAVRIEEMINYFPYDYPAPEAGEAPFRPTLTVLDSPWNEGTKLVHIAVQGRMPAREERPPLNLVFLIDTSGSMQDPAKLPLLKQSFRLMLSQLRPQDEVAIVTYAGSAGEVLPPTPAGERSRILAALDRLEAGGSTAGQAGLQQAYATAEAMTKDGEISRVILATDGDFNVGISDPGKLEDFIARKRESGTYLSVLGFGRGNLDDATMQALAQNGNGTAAYIDTLSEAQKVLVDQLTGSLFPIADDVKIQVEFNPAEVAEYRLIGYETRALKREDFNNDAVDAGEIGAGTSVTAIYEITPVGSPAILNDPLRYGGKATAATGPSGELGYLKMRWKAPGAAKSELLESPILPATRAADEDVRFSVAIAGFGQLLKGGKYLHDWGYDDAIALANGARGEDPFGYRTEAVKLMRIAKSLSAR